MFSKEEKLKIKKAVSESLLLDNELKKKVTSLFDDTSCIYNGSEYSPGSLVCQNGNQMVCDTGGSGVWFATGQNC